MTRIWILTPKLMTHDADLNAYDLQLKSGFKAYICVFKITSDFKALGLF